MSKTVAAPRADGPYETGKNKRPEKVGGPSGPGKHEKPVREAGTYIRKDKPLTHAENETHHSGRPHPAATTLADSELLGGGKLRLSDATKEKK